MKTKNNSVFAAKYILVSRKDYDEVLAKNEQFLHRLMGHYRRSWSLAGVKFHFVNAKDFVQLYKMLV